MNLFQTVCFLVLMQNGSGLSDKAPSYIREKMYLLECSEQMALGALDIHNMRKVREWYSAWKVELPEFARFEIEQQEEAASRFGL